MALVLQDRLNSAGDRQLVDWVRAGGTLVTADTDQVLSFAAPLRQPGPGGPGPGTRHVGPRLRLPLVRGVDAIEVTAGVVLRVPPGATGCFPTVAGGAFLVVMPLGAGELVLLGSPDPWTNANLGQQDNSVLAANILAPSPSGPRVQWVVGPRAGGGHQSLWQLMPPRVKEGLIELLVALVLLALWRARRLGRPVDETPAVELAGSELVVAVGNLLHQGGRLDDAATILRTIAAPGHRGQSRRTPERATRRHGDGGGGPDRPGPRHDPRHRGRAPAERRGRIGHPGRATPTPSEQEMAHG